MFSEPLPPSTNPCLPSPCGPNADCRVQVDHPICTCISGMYGAPPNCRPECVIDQDCTSSLACIQKKCLDPCVGSCGFNTDCKVQNHRPMCQCYEGYEGDPFSGCAKGEILIDNTINIIFNDIQYYAYVFINNLFSHLSSLNNNNDTVILYLFYNLKIQ